MFLDGRVQALFISLCSYCFFLLPGLGVADTIEKKQTMLITFSAGPAWYDAGESQTFNLQPNVVNTYAVRNATRALASGELSLNVQRSLGPTLLGQIGLAIAKSSDATLQGDIWQTADPNFNNFTYQYHISHAHVAVKGKLLSLLFSQTWTPYLSGSVGVGRNHAYDYSSTPSIFEVMPMPDFQANTQTTFTYTAGIGVQSKLCDHWSIGVGYEFSDWGSSALARSLGQTLNTGLALTHLYTNQLQMNISYVFFKE